MFNGKGFNTIKNQGNINNSLNDTFTNSLRKSQNLESLIKKLGTEKIK